MKKSIFKKKRKTGIFCSLIKFAHTVQMDQISKSCVNIFCLVKICRIPATDICVHHSGKLNFVLLSKFFCLQQLCETGPIREYMGYLLANRWRL